MIENKEEVSRNLEKALQALEQAKQRVANEKKKQNEKKRKTENHHKYIMGGIIVKYFPDCYSYDEGDDYSTSRDPDLIVNRLHQFS